ncbi:hypothetical protein MJO28_017788 [Puccinia striiformis f. sp. tritici]|nr:hypothetical protein MJO28_017788 [Puccinia striiformis f. sp. tritici]
MSSPFIGLPISAELSNGTIVEGTIQDIDPRTGKLKLRQARFVKFDGTFSEIQASFILEKDSVKDLMLLSTTRQNSALSPSDSDSSSGPSHNYNPHQQKKNQQQNSVINQSNPDQSSSHNGSEVTIKQSQQPPPSRKKQRDHAKKQHDLHGNPHPDSHSNAADNSFSAPEDTEGIPSPPQRSPPTTVATHQIPIATSPSGVVRSDFNQDFDFQAGLMAFDKAKLWAEIASTDSTDPKDRLVSHNRKKINGVHFNLNNQQQQGGGRQMPLEEDKLRRQRNLGPTEMVLSIQEQVTNGSTISNPICSQQQRQSSEEVEVAEAEEGRDQGGSYLISSDQKHIYPVTLNRLNMALSKASVEFGPSLVQRIENGSRSMTDYIIKLLQKSSSSTRGLNQSSAPNSNSSISILVSSIGPKSSTAIRTGALLSLKGFQVFLILNNTITQNRKPTKGRNDAFEFQLRLFSSTGAKTCGSIQELPTSPTLIIESLAENSVSTSSSFPDKSWINYTLSAPTMSIDIPSYLNYDNGESLVSTNLIPSPQYLVCLAALPTGVYKQKKLDKIPKEICLIDLTLSNLCWKTLTNNDDEEEEEDTSNNKDINLHEQISSNPQNVAAKNALSLLQLLNINTDPITTPLNPTLSKSTVSKPPSSSSKPTTSIAPASWGDEWYTIIKIA